MNHLGVRKQKPQDLEAIFGGGMDGMEEEEQDMDISKEN